MPGQRHRGRGDHRRQEHSPSPHDRLLKAVIYRVQNTGPAARPMPVHSVTCVGIGLRAASDYCPEPEELEPAAPELPPLPSPPDAPGPPFIAAQLCAL